MLWNVQYKSPSGAQFNFNCYRHWAMLLILDAGGMGNWIQSKERVTQGGHLDMIMYGIVIPPPPPLTRYLRDAHLEVLQLLYAHNVESRRTYGKIKPNSEELMRRRPYHIPFPKRTNSILVIS